MLNCLCTSLVGTSAVPYSGGFYQTSTGAIEVSLTLWQPAKLSTYMESKLWPSYTHEWESDVSGASGLSGNMFGAKRIMAQFLFFWHTSLLCSNLNGVVVRYHFPIPLVLFLQAICKAVLLFGNKTHLDCYIFSTLGRRKNNLRLICWECSQVCDTEAVSYMISFLLIVR